MKKQILRLFVLCFVFESLCGCQNSRSTNEASSIAQMVEISSALEEETSFSPNEGEEVTESCEDMDTSVPSEVSEQTSGSSPAEQNISEPILSGEPTSVPPQAPQNEVPSVGSESYFEKREVCWNLYDYIRSKIDDNDWSEMHVKEDRDTDVVYLEIWAVNQEKIQGAIDQYYKENPTKPAVDVVFHQAACSRALLKSIQEDILKIIKKEDIFTWDYYIYDERVVFRTHEENEILTQFLEDYKYKNFVRIDVIEEMIDPAV